MLLATVALLLTRPGPMLDVVYTRVGELELRMDMYPPAASATPTPAVVVVHGGAWVAGKRQDMAQLCEAIADEGMLAATVQYRLAPAHKYPAMLDDVQTAVRFLRSRASRYNVDPTRIGAAGASAGGHLSLLLGYTDTRDPNPARYASVSSRVQVVFDIFGPTHFLEDFGPGIDPLIAAVLGKPRAEATAEMKAASPILYVDKSSVPTFILHGTVDPIVPVRQSQRLEKALKEAGITFETFYMEGVGHELLPNDATLRERAMDGVRRGIAFLKRALFGPSKSAQVGRRSPSDLQDKAALLGAQA